ncbi:MAG TPA: hypothetical protein VNT75_08360 [Symbiobacteriaceae bacterium]|nr:hypothetical protein [Symbiobacteriaceae bacterium]
MPEEGPEIPESPPIGAEVKAPSDPIGPRPATAGMPIRSPAPGTTRTGLPIRSAAEPPAGGRPVEGEPEFGLPGASIESPGAYFGGTPVGGPGSIFNIGGAPIAVLGGVFGGGLPIGGPVTQIFRSGAPVPNTLYIVTLESSGPIGQFFLPSGGVPIGEGGAGTEGLPIGMGFGEGGAPIGLGGLMP